MFSHAPIGLVPRHLRPARELQPPRVAQPLIEEPAVENEAPLSTEAPEPATQAFELPAVEPDYGWPPRHMSKGIYETLAELSDRIGFAATCRASCCRRAKRCLWAGGGHCMRGRREEILPIIKRWLELSGDM